MYPTTDKNFNEYLRLKSMFNISFDGIAFNRVLASVFLRLAYNKELYHSKGYKELLWPFYKGHSFQKLFSAFSSHKTVITYLSSRRDYANLLDSYIEGVNAVKINVGDLSYDYVFNFLNIIRGLRLVVFKKLPLKEKMLIGAYFTYYLNILAHIKKLFSDVNLVDKKYVPFNSCMEVEALLAQYFGSKGATTYHISHGLSYVKYKSALPMDAINGENINSNNILTWGITSKADLINNYNIDADRIVVAGDPLYPAKQIYINTNFKKCIVFLARPVYDEGNIALLTLIKEIAHKGDTTFSIKAHPASDLKAFDAVIEGSSNITLLSNEHVIGEILNAGEFDFAIAFNTTVYFEAMYYNLICLRYSVYENDEFNGIDDKFSDNFTFKQQIEKFKQIDKLVLSKQIQQVLEDNLGMGINCYKDILN